MSKEAVNKIKTVKTPSTLSLLGLIFVTLKLCGVINWSWWYVVMPFYIVPTTIAAGIVIALLFTLTYEMIKK